MSATTKLNIGKIPISKGEYQEGTAYQRLNQVTMLGSTYQSKIDDNTSAPAQMGADGAVENINTEKWLCVAVGNISSAKKVVYNNETSGLEAGNVQAAIDEVGSKVSYLKRSAVRNSIALNDHIVKKSIDNGYIDFSGNIKTDENFKAVYVDNVLVQENEIWYYKGNSGSNGASVAFFKADMTFLSSITNLKSTDKYSAITIPADAKYATFASYAPVEGQVVFDVKPEFEFGQEKQFLGFATPSTNPGIPINNVFYFASEAGTYNNFKTSDRNKYVTIGEGLYIIYNTNLELNLWRAESLVEISQTLGNSDAKVLSQKKISELFTSIARSAVRNSIALNDHIVKKSIDNGYIDFSGNIKTDENFKAVYVDNVLVQENEIWYYKGNSGSNGASVAFFKADMTFLSSITNLKSTDKYSAITIPADAKYATFASYAPVEGQVVFDVKPEFEFGQEKSVLSYKLWTACGDSFTHGDFSSVTDKIIEHGVYAGKLQVYPYLIGNRIFQLDVQNVAVNGLTMLDFAKKGLYKKNVSVKSDYVTLYFGINDCHQSVSVGNINDTISDNTFYGAWNTVMEYLITNIPDCKIGIIISNGIDNVEYTNAERNIAKKFGVAFLDLAADEHLPYIIRQYERTDVDNTIRTMRDNYFRVSSSNFHPNEKAHAFESTIIEHFLKEL